MIKKIVGCVSNVNKKRSSYFKIELYNDKLRLINE